MENNKCKNSDSRQKFLFSEDEKYSPLLNMIQEIFVECDFPGEGASRSEEILNDLIILLKSYKNWKIKGQMKFSSGDELELKNALNLAITRQLMKKYNGLRSGRPSKINEIIGKIDGSLMFTKNWYDVCKEIESEYSKRTVYSALKKRYDQKTQIKD